SSEASLEKALQASTSLIHQKFGRPTIRGEVSSGEQVPIDLKRFTDSGINLVECPRCGRMRSLSPSKGALRFKAHTPRKQQTLLTEKRWSATGKTDWSVVEG